MTKEKIAEVVKKYKKLIEGAGYKPFQISNYERKHQGLRCHLQHCLYMLYEMDKLLEQNKTEKAFRWLGFIQGVLFTHEIKSLNDLKNDSRSSDKRR